MKKLGPAVLGMFHGKILNTHPVLLPKFGGHGMYGDRVFAAVLEAGEAESGVSKSSWSKRLRESRQVTFVLAGGAG